MLKLVFCVWQDATNSDSWTTVDEAKALEPLVIHSIGWLIVEDATRLVITHSWEKEEGGVLCALAIPKAWILELRHLPPLET